jgi:hypothetical protein
LVINGFGYTSFQTMLVGLPAGAISFVLVWIGALIPLYVRNSRCLASVCLSLVPLIGAVLLLCLPASRSWGIVVSTWLAGSTNGPISMSVGLMSSNVRGNTKKPVVGSIFFVFFCVGAIVSPQLWQREDAPRYYKGCVASIVSLGCLTVAYLVFYFTARRSNDQRDQIGLLDEDAVLIADLDRTEWQDRGFRYSY